MQKKKKGGRGRGLEECGEGTEAKDRRETIRREAKIRKRTGGENDKKGKIKGERLHGVVMFAIATHCLAV